MCVKYTCVVYRDSVYMCIDDWSMHSGNVNFVWQRLILFNKNIRRENGERN